MKKKSKSIFFVILILLISIGLTGYFQLRKNSLEDEKEILEKSLKSIQAELDGNSENKETKEMVTLVDVTKKRVIWSEIMSNILAFETPSLSFQSFSASNTIPHEIKVNGTAASTKSIQVLIERLKTAKNIKDPFVHSINSNGEASKTNFSLTFTLK